MRSWFSCVVVAVLASLPLLADEATAIARMAPVVVRIEVVSEEGEGGRMRRQSSVGSGAIIDLQGHVLTNYHVAGRGTAFLCRLADGTELPAVLVGADAMTDLAVIRLDLKRLPAGFTLPPPAEFADSTQLKTGDVVLSMGCPAGLNQSVTRGIVANPRMIMTRFVGEMDLDGESVGELVRWIGHDAVIFGGNSGGPLVDLSGRIVGVNEIGVGSLGGAIPAQTAREVAADLIREGRVSRSWTGLEFRPLLRSMTGQRGVLVSGVLPGSPAAAAKIQQGDRILAFDKFEVHAADAEGMPEVARIETSLALGESCTVRLVRGVEEMTFTLVPVERQPRMAREAELAAWGATFRELTAFSARKLRRDTTDGLIVDSLRSGGPADQAKPSLQLGDLLLAANGKPLKHLADLRLVTREALAGPEPQPVLVTLRRGEAEWLSVVRVAPETDPVPAPRVPKAWAGVATQVLLPELAKALGLEARTGIRVTQVLPNTAAAQADLRVGDILTRLDDRPIPSRRPEDADWFSSTLREYDPAAKVTLEVLREGKAVTLTLNLEERPAPPSELPALRETRLGFSARALAQDDRNERQLAAEDQGAIITRVERSGWADLAGLRSGDLLVELNGRPVTDRESLATLLSTLATERPRHVIFRVQRGISGAILECEPDWAALAAAEAR